MFCTQVKNFTCEQCRFHQYKPKYFHDEEKNSLFGTHCISKNNTYIKNRRYFSLPFLEYHKLNSAHQSLLNR